MAILTPAVPDSFVVYAGDVFVPAESLLDMKKNDKLQKLAKTSGFSVANRLRAQALEVLRTAGWDAVEMDMKRAAVGGPMRREDYPVNADGRLMLDLKVQLIGLVASWGRLSSYRPAINVSYRLLDKDGHLLRSSRTIYYCVAGFHCPPGIGSRTAAVGDKSACAFANFSTVESDPARVWVCFDSAFLKISEKLVSDLDQSGFE